MLMARASALALPETIIALNRTQAATAALRRFMLTLTALTGVSMIIIIATPLLDGYLYGVQNTPTDVAALVSNGAVWMALFPALAVIAFGLRGFLISARRTGPVNVGMALNVLVTVVIIAAGLYQQWEGIPTAAIALDLALVVESIYLVHEARKTGALTTAKPLVTAEV
jgi:Na+-driven multidrug efflux pump